MGNAGQIWLGEGPDGLKVIAFNSMLRPDSAADVAAKFAEAYFAGDTEGLKACLSGSFVGNFELYSGDGSAVVVNAIKGLSDVDADPCTASVEFKESADSDHYLYLSIELVRESDGWKVLSYGLEG